MGVGLIFTVCKKLKPIGTAFSHNYHYICKFLHFTKVKGNDGLFHPPAVFPFTEITMSNTFISKACALIVSIIILYIIGLFHLLFQIPYYVKEGHRVDSVDTGDGIVHVIDCIANPFYGLFQIIRVNLITGIYETLNEMVTPPHLVSIQPLFENSANFVYHVVTTFCPLLIQEICHCQLY